MGLFSKAVVARGIVPLALALACLVPAAAQAQVGYVAKVEGIVQVRLPSGQATAAQVGQTFPEGTIFEVGAVGSTTLHFTDGQVIMLSRQTLFRVELFRFTAGNVRASSVSVGLVRGTMRFIAGAVGASNPEAIRIAAGDARVTIESRGADFVATVDPQTGQVGDAAVLAGQISINATTVAYDEVTANQFVRWGPGVRREVMPIDAAPALVQGTISALRATPLPNAPPLEALLASLAPTGSGPAPVPRSPFDSDLVPPTTPPVTACVGSPC